MTLDIYPACIYLFKFNDRNNRTKYGICHNKDTRMTSVPCHAFIKLTSSGVFILNFQRLTPCSNVSVIDFEQVNGHWVIDTTF